MKGSNKRIVTVMIAIMAVCSLAASTPEGGMLIESTAVNNFPQVEIRLSAWNAEGLPLENLEPKDFAIRENNGAPIVPDEVIVDKNAPLSVVLVLDVSQSMINKPIADARAAAARFLDRLSPGDKAALIAFSDGVDPDPQVLNPTRELAFSAQLDPMYDLVEKLEASGGTHLYNAVLKAVRMTNNLPSGHRAVLVLSDGVNEPANIGDPDGPITLAKESNVPIYVIGLGSRTDETYLRRLTSETGGVLKMAPSSAELAETFDDMAELLKTQYALTYTSQVQDGAESVDLGITLTASGMEITGQSVLSNLPALPTSTPQPSPTSTPVPPTPVPTAVVMPTAAPVPPKTFMDTIRDLPWFYKALAAVILLGIIAIILRASRKKPEGEYRCARCGYVLPEGVDVCPQCGESRRYANKQE